MSSRRGRTYALQLLLALGLAYESEYQRQFPECSVRVKRREKEVVRCASAGLAVFFAILKGCRRRSTLAAPPTNSHPVFYPLFQLLHSTQRTMKVSPYLDRSSLVVLLCCPRLSLSGFCCLISAHPRTDPSPLLLPTQIWSMKKDSEAAAKKKPKVNAAQLRVQKGTSSSLSFSPTSRFQGRVGPSPLSRAPPSQIPFR